jgi:hypothetical protein
MSTVKATNFQNASSATANMVTDASGNVSFGNAVTVAGNTTITGSLVPSSSFLRNRIINGDMRIDQRNAGASVTNISGGVYTVDRWAANATQASKFTIQRNAGAVTPPSGFVNYLGITSSSAYSVLSSDTFDVRQLIEGLNVSDLDWGTASAKTITFSFYVRSSLTGTFGGALANSAFNRSYPFTYTISVANTWEQKTVTIAGDTSGTWLTTNGIGIHVFFGLGAGTTYSGTAGAWTGSGLTTVTGAVSVVGTSGATFYVTGVQLEVGTVATPFERQIYNAQLAQCQRYFCKSYDQATVPGTATFSGSTATNAAASFNGVGTVSFIFPVEMRSAPTVTMYSTINASTTGKCSSTSVDYNTNGASANTRQAYSSATASGGANSQLFYQWTAAIEL